MLVQSQNDCGCSVFGWHNVVTWWVHPVLSIAAILSDPPAARPIPQACWNSKTVLFDDEILLGFECFTLLDLDDMLYLRVLQVSI